MIEQEPTLKIFFIVSYFPTLPDDRTRANFKNLFYFFFNVYENLEKSNVGVISIIQYRLKILFLHYSSLNCNNYTNDV